MKYKSGDIFLVPSGSEGFAVCQVICAFKGRFKKVFSFGVLGITGDDGGLNLKDGEFLLFNNARGFSSVIFTSVEKLKKGEWKIFGNIPLNVEKEKLKFFRNAGAVYFEDEFIEMVDASRYKDFNVMAVAGYDLVQSYIKQLFE